MWETRSNVLKNDFNQCFKAKLWLDCIAATMSVSLIWPQNSSYDESHTLKTHHLMNVTTQQHCLQRQSKAECWYTPQGIKTQRRHRHSPLWSPCPMAFSWKLSDTLTDRLQTHTPTTHTTRWQHEPSANVSCPVHDCCVPCMTVWGLRDSCEVESHVIC